MSSVPAVAVMLICTALSLAGADANVKVHVDGSDYTPLKVAYKTQIIQLLKDYGAKESISEEDKQIQIPID